MPKTTFRLTLKVKRANIEFKEGLGIGVLASQDITFDLPEDYSDARLAISLRDHRQEIINDVIQVDTEVVK